MQTDTYTALYPTKQVESASWTSNSLSQSLYGLYYLQKLKEWEFHAVRYSEPGLTAYGTVLLAGISSNYRILEAPLNFAWDASAVTAPTSGTVYSAVFLTSVVIVWLSQSQCRQRRSTATRPTTKGMSWWGKAATVLKWAIVALLTVPHAATMACFALGDLHSMSLTWSLTFQILSRQRSPRWSPKWRSESKTLARSLWSGSRARWVAALSWEEQQTQMYAVSMVKKKRCPRAPEASPVGLEDANCGLWPSFWVEKVDLQPWKFPKKYKVYSL